MKHRFIPLLLLTTHSLQSLAASCFAPSGAEGNDTVLYQCPTDNISQYSMCCFASAYTGADGPDKCVRAGPTYGDWLCQNDHDQSLWRRTCSDKNWGPGCLRLCADKTRDKNNNLMEDWDEPVTKCHDGSYCCGAPADGPGLGNDCCNQGKGSWIFNGTVSTTKPLSENAPPSQGSNSTSDSTSGASSLSSNLASAAPNSAPSSGVIAGAIVGSLAALLLLGVGQFFLIKWILERKQAKRVGLVNTGTADRFSELSNTLAVSKLDSKNDASSSLLRITPVEVWGSPPGAEVENSQVGYVEVPSDSIMR